MCKTPQGMTLMETVIALAIIGVVIPMILAATAGSLKSNRLSEADTRASILAAEFREDLSFGWKGEGQYFDRNLTYPDFGGGDVIEAFCFSADGSFKGRITDLQYENGLRDATYIVRVRGEDYTTGGANPLAASRITITVETPAIAPKQSRESEEFVTLATDPNS